MARNMGYKWRETNSNLCKISSVDEAFDIRLDSNKVENKTGVYL